MSDVGIFLIHYSARVFTRLDSLLKMGAVLGGVVVLGYFLLRRKKSSKGK